MGKSTAPYTPSSLGIEVGQVLKGTDVAEVLNRLRFKRRAPKMLFCDSGPVFTSQIMELWAYQDGVRIDFSRPGKGKEELFEGGLDMPVKKALLAMTRWLADFEDLTSRFGLRGWSLRKREEFRAALRNQLERVWIGDLTRTRECFSGDRSPCL